MEPLVFSMSEIQLFNRCRKAAELGYVRNLDPIFDNNAVRLGSAFHAELEAYAHDRRGTAAPRMNGGGDLEMFEVAQEYLRRRGSADFDTMAEIISIEEPLYTKIEPSGPVAGLLTPNVWVRTTFDLVYRNQAGWIVVRDYKTFEAAPSEEYSLDFQARLYIAVMMIHFKTSKVQFEFEYVRRTTPGTKRGRAPAAGKADTRESWKESECYIRQPLVIPVHEAQATWQEAQFLVGQMLTARAVGGAAWYHQPLKAGPHSCGSCFYRKLCSADAQGTLDEETIEELANRKSATRLTLPDGTMTTVYERAS